MDAQLGDKDRPIAATLFVLTALSLPVLFRVEGDGATSHLPAQFLVQSAAFELRLQTLLEGDSQSNLVPAELGQLFDPEEWAALAVEMEEPDRFAVATQIAVVCVALDRKEDASKLLAKSGVKLEPEASFAYLLGDQPLPRIDRLHADLDTSFVPAWAGKLLVDRYREGGAALVPLNKETLESALAEYAESIGLLAAVLAVLFLSGIVVLVVAPRFLSKHREPASVFSNGRIGATPLRTYLLFAAWFVLSTAAGMLLSPLFSDLLSKAGMVLVSYIATALAGVLLVKYRGGIRNRSLASAVDLAPASLSPRALGIGVLGYLGAVPLVFVLVVAATLLLGGGSEGVNPGIPILVGAPTDQDRWIVLLTVVVMAPLFEEFLFRGFLFQQLRRFFGGLNGAALSALIFASVHLSIESFLPLFGLGLVLAGVYHFSRSLWACALTHALWNLGTAVSVLVLFG